MNNSRQLVLFDLDGTLVDPAGSITGGIAGALVGAGLPVPAPEDLQRMVGPALSVSLLEIAKVPADRLDEVIAAYRAGYRSTGMAASRPYPGIAGLLERLRESCVLAVATQKPQTMARELLRVQGLDRFFDSVHGSPDDELDAAPDGKRSIVAAALAAHRGQYGSAVMIGDRSHDVHGAAANGLPCIGVSWGFAAPGELQAAGAAEIVDDAAQLPAAIGRHATPVPADGLADGATGGRAGSPAAGTADSAGAAPGATLPSAGDTAEEVGTHGRL